MTLVYFLPWSWNDGLVIRIGPGEMRSYRPRGHKVSKKVNVPANPRTQAKRLLVFKIPMLYLPHLKIPKFSTYLTEVTELFDLVH